MSSFIEDNLKKLKQNHYVRVASASNNYWFDFTFNVVKTYQNKHANKFCLILQGSPDINDAYIFPFNEIKDFFSEDYLDKRGRWTGSIRNNIMRISVPGKAKSVSVSRYYNALYLLDFESEPDQYVVKESEIIKYDVDKFDSNHLRELIRTYNKQYEVVIPEKKIVVSEQVARPGLISDYVKQLQNYTCQICKQKGFVQSNHSYYVEAHHIVELHKLIPGSLCSDNIIIVCPTCHKKLHYAKVEYKIDSTSIVKVNINGAEYSFKRNVIAKTG